MFGFGNKRKPISQAWDEASQVAQPSQPVAGNKKPISQAWDEALQVVKPQKSDTIQLKPEAEMSPIERKPTFGETVKSSFLGFAKAGQEGIARMGTALKYAGKANQVGGERTTLDKITDPFAIGETRFGRAVKSSVGKVEEAVGTKVESVYGKSAEYFGGRPGYIPELSSFRDETTGKVSLGRIAQVFSEGLGSSIPGVAVGVATKSPLAAGAVMGIVEAGDAAQTYAEKIAENKGVSVEDLSDVDIKKVDEMATYYGMASAALESIFPAQLGRVIGVAGKEAERNLLKRVFLKAPVEALRSIANEGGTEGVQRFTQNVIAKLSEIDPDQELSEGVLDEAIAGAITGVGISTATTIAAPSGMENVPVAPAQLEEKQNPPVAQQNAPRRDELPKELQVPKYEAKKSVRELFTALEEDNTEAVESISSSMSKKELQETKAILEEMQNTEEANTDPELYDKVATDIETVEKIIEKKDSSLAEQAKAIVGGVDNVIAPTNISDTNTIKQIVEKVKEAVDDDTKASIDEKLKSLDTATLPGVSEARSLDNENNPFKEIADFDTLQEKYVETVGELYNKDLDLKEKKKAMLSQKKAAPTREEKTAIQSSIDALDTEKRDIEAQMKVIEEQGRAKSLLLAQETIDRIKEIEPDFDVAESVDNNWELEDYTNYYEGIKNKQPKEKPYEQKQPREVGRGKLPRVERVAEGEPSVSSPSPSKYAEEAGRDTGTDGSSVGERPSDGRGLTDVVQELVEKGIKKEKAEKIKEMFDTILVEGEPEAKQKAINWLSDERSNPSSRRVFEELIGKKLPKTQKDSRKFLQELAGVEPQSKKWMTEGEVKQFVLDHIGDEVVVDDNKADWKKGRQVRTANPSLNKLKEIDGKYVVYTRGEGEYSRPISSIRDFIFEGKSVVGDVKNEEYAASIFKKEEPKATKEEIEKLAQSKETFTEEEKKVLATYEGAGATRESGRGLLDEFFTPQEVANKVWDIVFSYMPAEGRAIKVLEPAVGTGRFLAKSLDGTNFTGYETNPVSAKATAALYPKADIKNTSFETIFIDEKGKKKAFEPTYDIVVGNPPYGNHRGKYKGLGEEPKIGRYEEYFIKRSLDLTKEGGIVAMVVPSSFLRSGNDYAKKAISRLGELVDAYRLPNKIFKGTDVGTDIVIFERKTTDDTGEVFRSTEISDDKFFRAPMNSHKILGKKTLKKGRFGDMEEFIEGNLDEALSKIATDRIDALKGVVEEIEAKAEQMEEERVVEDVPVKSKEEAVNEGVKATLRPMKRVVKEKEGSIYQRDQKKPYRVVSVKKGGTQIIEQATVSDEERAMYEHTLEDGSIDKKFLSDTSKAYYYKFGYYTEFNYVSGDIYEKLEALEQDKSEMDPSQYEKQKKLLESVLPKPATIRDITISPLSNIAGSVFDGKTLVDRFKEWARMLPRDAYEGTSYGYIEDYLNGRPTNVGDKARNREIRKKRRDIGNKLFTRFIRDELDPAIQKELEEKYNRMNNAYHSPSYAEYPFSTELSKTFNGKPLELRPIQLEGASFLSNKGVGILAYEVGVGKTLAAIGAISEVMRRGWTKRPLVVVPKNLRSKWVREIADSIPGIKINDLGNLGSDFKYAGNIKDFSIEEGTLTVVTEEGFKRIGFSEETFDNLTRDLQDATYKRGEKSAREKESEKVKTEEIVGKARRGTEFPLTFEELGFDHITFDEAHREKNVFSSAQTKKAGEGEQSKRKASEYSAVRGAVSERGLKAYLATQYILGKNGGRNVFLLTATPFNNSPVEIYSMLSLVAKKRLEDMGIKNINDFISLFIELETRFAFKANGSYSETDQVRKFVNLQQLQGLVREYIDFRTGEEAGVPRPSKIRKKPLVKMNEKQWKAVQEAQVLFEDKDAGVLKGITELQKITLSPYLSRFSNLSFASVSPKKFVEDSPKIRYAVESIKKAHKANPKAGQIVYVDKGIEAFTKMQEHFVKDLGYKKSEVAIMDGSVAEAKRDEIKEQFQNGGIRILMTTIKEGVDLQRLSTDLYNLYLPWNPTDLVQIEGRTWRQGSLYDKVRVHYPLLENSVDVFLFQKLEEKAARLDSVFSYKGNDLDVSDIDFEAFKVDLITDPVKRIQVEYELENAKIHNQISRVKAEAAFIGRRIEKIAKLESDIAEEKKYLPQYIEDSSRDRAKVRIKKMEEDRESEIEKIKKEGLDVEKVQSELNAKNQEILSLESKKKTLEEETAKRIEKAKGEELPTVYGEADFSELTEGMDDAGFFVEVPGMAFFDRSLRGKDGKFAGSKPVQPDEITSEEIKRYLSTSEARAIVERVRKEINPAIASVLQFKIAEELTYRGKAAQGLGGFFDPQEFLAAVSTAIPSEEDRGGLSEKDYFEKIFRHEINHAAFALLPEEKKQEIVKWYKGLSERELADIYDGDASVMENYRSMSVSGNVKNWDGSIVEPTTFLADEAFNRFMNKKGERTPLQRTVDRIIDALKRLLNRINAALFGKDRKRIEIERWYDAAFSKRGDVFSLPADLIPHLRSRFVIPGSVRYEVGANMDGGMAFVSKNLFGEEVSEEAKEKRRIYIQAFERVLQEKRPPSLGKMIEEEFQVKERRTMLSAERLQALAEGVESLAMDEGMQAGYLEGETATVLAKEQEMSELRNKIEESKLDKERQTEIQQELNDKAIERLKALVSLQRKMERQAEKFAKRKAEIAKVLREEKKESVREAKEEGKKKAKEAFSQMQSIREEIYKYVKENLPRSRWDKYLKVLRDAKTKTNLRNALESVDEDVKRIQRTSAIKRIRKILESVDSLPIRFQMLVKEVAEGIDWGNTRESTKKKLRKIDEYLKKNPEAMTKMPVRILRKLGILEKTPIGEVSSEKLFALNAHLEQIVHIGRIAKINEKAVYAKGLSDKLAMIGSLSEDLDYFKQSGLTREEREKITAWEKSLDTLQSTNFQIMPMDFFFYTLDGKKEMGANYTLIKKPVDVSFDNYWKSSNALKKSLFDFIEKLKEGGMNITDETWDRIGIHAIRAQKGGTAKLLGSGYDQQAIDSVVLNEDELALYGYLRQELDRMFPMIKEVYERVHNIELEGVDDYFPFLMDWSNRAPIYEELEAQYNNKKGVSGSGFTIKRVGGGNPVRVHALEAFLKHTDQAAYFIAMEETVRQVRDIVSSRRYKEAVGEKAQSYVMRWLEVIERHGVPKDDKSVALFDGLRRNITLGTLAFKLTTVPIQFGAIFSGAAEIGTRAFSGFKEIVTSKKMRDFVLSSSEQMQMRVGDSPEFSEDIPTDRKGSFGRKSAEALNKAREYGMWAIKKTDFYTAAGTWLGAYKGYLEDRGIEFDEKNVDQDAKKYADYVVRITQSSNEYKDLPPLLAQKYRTFGKILFQFQNFTLTQWNFARSIVGKNVSEDPAKAAWQASMIFSNIVFAMAIRSLIARGIWGAPDDDDEESIIAAIMWEISQQIPVLGSQFYNLKNFLDNPTSYTVQNWGTGVVAIDKTVDAIQSVPQVFVPNQKDETRAKNIVRAAESAGNLAGIPASTQMSQIWRSFLSKE